MIFYTYEVYDPVLDMKYIGSRTNKKVKSIDSDSEYKGTVVSKKWKNLWKEISARSIKTILGIYSSKEEAILEEIRLHELHDVGNNPKFFNEARQTCIGFTQAGMPKSENHKSLISKGRKENPLEFTEDYRLKLRNKKLGSNNPSFGIPKEKIVCPICGKLIAKQIQKYHQSGKNCKVSETNVR